MVVLLLIGVVVEALVFVVFVVMLPQLLLPLLQLLAARMAVAVSIVEWFYIDAPEGRIVKSMTCNARALQIAKYQGSAHRVVADWGE